jgi:uncharacterized protein
MSLLDRPQQNTEAKSWLGEFPLQNRYSSGLAGERFFREIMDHARLMGTHCPDCDYTYVPPSIYCERCFGHLDDWVEVGPEGTILSYTALWVAMDGSHLPQPDILGLIQLDGADSVLVHRLGKVTLQDLYVGERVKVVYKPRRQRTGTILDIVHFAPVEP